MQAKTSERSDAGWRGVQVSSKSHDIVRDDSRYTGTSGSNRKSYITHFRDSADSSREHNAVGSRASDFASDATARSFNARRSKIDDIWTMPEFRAINAPPYFSRTDVLGEIAKIATVRNSSEIDRPLFHASFDNSKTIQNQKIGWTRFSPDLKVDRTNYSGKMNTGSLERSKSGVTLNENLESVVPQTRYSYSAGNDFLATHASGVERTNDDISAAIENRRKSSSIRSDSFANKDIGDEMLHYKLEQDKNSSSLQIAGTNSVPSDSQTNVATRFIHKSRNSIRKNTDSGVVTDSSRHIGGNQHDGLNNSERSTHGAETRLTLISNLKSEVVGYSRPPVFPRRNAVLPHRNFVKLRYPYSTSNRQRNVSDVALNMKLKNSNDVDSIGVQLRQPAKGHFMRTAAKRPVGLNNHATSKPTKNSHSSFVQKSQSQGIGVGNKTEDEYGSAPVQHDAYLKNWPNDALQDIEDLYNYEKYTSSLEDESSHESELLDADGTPILSSNNYFDHTDPILDSSVKKIIHWLKVPPIVPNTTQFFDYNDDKPIEPIFESTYGHLEPNRPLSISAHDDNYETVVLQDTSPNQDLDKIDYHANYPIRWSNPSLITRPQYAMDSSYPSPTLIPSSWPDVASQRNKTVYNPLTHVTQNTVVHILNDGLKKPNVTVTQLKAPEAHIATADQAASSESSSESSLAQRPNVHIMFTSQKDKDKEPPKQETNIFPSLTSNTNCPTIMINTYTRVNNTIQSKEGCTDLNIIVNSHVSNTNVFTPSGTPAIAEDQQTSLATQSYGDADESEKYAEAFTDLSHEDSLDSYVTASTGTYGFNPFETPQPGQHDYYEPLKDPDEIPDQWNDPVQSLSTIEVFQGTQISVSASNVPLADAEASPAGLVGPDDDASSSAVDPPAAGANGPSVDGNSGSEIPSVSELPAYLIKPGPVKGQANNGLAPGSLQLPALPSLPSRPSRPNIAIKPGSSIASPSLLTSGSSGSLSDDDDDDDDDDFDMSPSGMLHSIASAFTYFSFLNPLSYSIFSLAAAPFAAMAAGMIGVAAVVFPWAVPSVLDFGRSADRMTSFAPNLEEFVRRAVHKYDRLNEWKSRRRKRRR